MYNNKFFKLIQESIEERIQEEYHKRINEISILDKEERCNIKMNILGELYYEQGVNDGIELILNILKK